MPCRPLENLSRRQRQATPPRFAEYLIRLVLDSVPAARVAVLWTCRRTPYQAFWPLATCWDQRRDARTYAGPWPVICHPPCGPWGKYKANCYHAKEDGILALEFVHRWGGIVEQPVGSSLFREHGRGGKIIQVNQSDYGHLALKPTLLYLVPLPGGGKGEVCALP